MKTLNISLNDGFKLRNLIKKKIATLSLAIYSLPISFDKEIDGKKMEILNIKYGSVNQMVDLCMKSQEVLGKLNVAIDGANSDVRPLLDAKESYSAQETLLRRLLENIQENSKSVNKVFNSVTGVYDVTPLEQNFDDEKISEFKELEKSIRRKIHELEENISDLNGKIHFDFQIDELVYNFVYDL